MKAPVILLAATLAAAAPPNPGKPGNYPNSSTTEASISSKSSATTTSGDATTTKTASGSQTSTPSGIPTPGASPKPNLLQQPVAAPGLVRPVPVPAPQAAPPQQATGGLLSALGHLLGIDLGIDVHIQSRSPPKLKKRGKSFSLGQEGNPSYNGGDATNEVVRAHAKFASPMPPWVFKAKANKDLTDKFNSYIAQGDDDNEKGTVVAKPPAFYDIQYVVPVDIGTPPQRVHLNLDTGSADLWTFTSDTYQPEVNNHALYRPNESDTSHLQSGSSWKVSYGDGAGASGIVYTDVVALGDVHFDEQVVQSAVQVSYDISSDTFSSGIIGMSLSGANTVRPQKQKTFIENVQDDLDEPVFTVNLRKGKPGNYNFGYINGSEYEGDISYVEVEKDQHFWKVPFTGYQVGDGDWREFEWDAVIDTGTTMLLLPDGMVHDYYKEVKGAGRDQYTSMWMFPCDSHTPDFKFEVGGYKGTVPGSYINYVQSSPQTCFGGIQSAEGIGMAIIGDVMIKSQFIVFDIGNFKVGFAEKHLDDVNEGPQSAPMPTPSTSPEQPSPPGGPEPALTPDPNGPAFAGVSPPKPFSASASSSSSSNVKSIQASALPSQPPQQGPPGPAPGAAPGPAPKPPAAQEPPMAGPGFSGVGDVPQ